MIVTNAFGVAFAATVLSAADFGVTMVFPEDGATNVLGWTDLCPSSQETVCQVTDFSPVPPNLAATYRLAQRELRRIVFLLESRRIETSAASERRAGIRQAFEKRARAAGLSEMRCRQLWYRLVGHESNMSNR